MNTIRLTFERDGKAVAGTLGCKFCGAKPLHHHKDDCPRVVSISIPPPTCEICGESARVACLWCNEALCGRSSCTVKHEEIQHDHE